MAILPELASSFFKISSIQNLGQTSSLKLQGRLMSSILAAMISDTLKFLEKHAISKATFCGHSLSGMLFSRFATLWGDRVKSLIMIDIDPIKAPQQPLTPIILQLNEVLDSIRREKIEDLEQAGKHGVELLGKLIENERWRSHFLKNLVRDKQIDFR